LVDRGDRVDSDLASTLAEALYGTDDQLIMRAITSSGAALAASGRAPGDCSDDHMRFDLKTKASPEQVLRALTDFTDARLQIWNQTLDPKTYDLRDSGETWAVARESSPRSPFWVVVR
jgi:hypothetical protein